MASRVQSPRDMPVPTTLDPEPIVTTALENVCGGVDMQHALARGQTEGLRYGLTAGAGGVVGGGLSGGPLGALVGGAGAGAIGYAGGFMYGVADGMRETWGQRR